MNDYYSTDSLLLDEQATLCRFRTTSFRVKKAFFPHSAMDAATSAAAANNNTINSNHNNNGGGGGVNPHSDFIRGAEINLPLWAARALYRVQPAVSNQSRDRTAIVDLLPPPALSPEALIDFKADPTIPSLNPSLNSGSGGGGGKSGGDGKNGDDGNSSYCLTANTSGGAGGDQEDHSGGRMNYNSTTATSSSSSTSVSSTSRQTNDHGNTAAAAGGSSPIGGGAGGPIGVAGVSAAAAVVAGGPRSPFLLRHGAAVTPMLRRQDDRRAVLDAILGLHIRRYVYVITLAVNSRARGQDATLDKAKLSPAESKRLALIEVDTQQRLGWRGLRA